MTNKEKYKQAFSVLHTSENFSPEVEMMAKFNKKHNFIKGIVAASVAAVTIGGLGTTAYAANVGGIQRQIQIWINGDQTNATLDIDENAGTYAITVTNEAGEEETVSQGGGISIDMFGNERPVNEEEIKEHLDMPDVQYLDDGRIMVFYHSQAIEITDKFNEDGVCYTTVSEGDKNFYMTIEKNAGYGISTTKYPDPDENR